MRDAEMAKLFARVEKLEAALAAVAAAPWADWPVRRAVGVAMGWVVDASNQSVRVAKREESP